MGTLTINGKEIEFKGLLEIIHGSYYVDGVKVGNGDEIDNLTYKI